MSDRYKMVLKTGLVVVPVVMAILSGIYGDIQPMARDLCEKMLPEGSLVPRFVLPDAGAVPR